MTLAGGRAVSAVGGVTERHSTTWQRPRIWLLETDGSMEARDRVEKSLYEIKGVSVQKEWLDACMQWILQEEVCLCIVNTQADKIRLSSDILGIPYEKSLK